MGTELQHVLHISNRTNVRTDNLDLVCHQVFSIDFVSGSGSGGAQHDIDSSGLGQSLVKLVENRIVDVESGTDDVIGSFLLLQLLLVDGMLCVIGSQLSQRFDVVETSGQGSDLHAQFVSILDGQMSQTTNAQHCTLSPYLVVSLQRSVDSNACTKQRRNFLNIKSLG